MQITVKTSGKTKAELLANLLRMVENLSREAGEVAPTDFGYFHNGSYTVQADNKPGYMNGNVHADNG
jgi:hypothetical protein